MPTHYKGSPDEVLALDTVIKLTRSLNSLQAQLTPYLQKDFGITESQFGVLEALLHLGPLSQGQLCQKILRSGSNVTTVVDNLERDGLVTRTVYPEIPPRVEYQLTELGRTLTDPLDTLWNWAAQHMHSVNTARSNYDLAHQPAEESRPERRYAGATR